MDSLNPLRKKMILKIKNHTLLWDQ